MHKVRIVTKMHLEAVPDTGTNNVPLLSIFKNRWNSRFFKTKLSQIGGRLFHVVEPKALFPSTERHLGINSCNVAFEHSANGLGKVFNGMQRSDR